MVALSTALGWMADGTALCRSAITRFDDAALKEPSLLPGWTRAHVVAHLAGNAAALGNLVHWARTGERTPMYSSPEDRRSTIESGAVLPAEDLAAWFDESASTLAGAMSTLTDDQWSAEVVTAQGRTVPADQTPWMRAREVMIHAVDLDAGITFVDLPQEFLAALRDDILAKRGPDTVPVVDGPLPEVAAYLAGRPYSGVTTQDGTPAEPLPPWL